MSIITVKLPFSRLVLIVALGFERTALRSGMMFSPNELSMPPGASVWFFAFAFAKRVQTSFEDAVVSLPSRS